MNIKVAAFTVSEKSINIYMGESSIFPKSITSKIEILKLTIRPPNTDYFKFEWSTVLKHTESNQGSCHIICLVQDPEADFLWKVRLKILNSGIILKTFTHVSSVAGKAPR